jgi:hypothetical protein
MQISRAAEASAEAHSPRHPLQRCDVVAGTQRQEDARPSVSKPPRLTQLWMLSSRQRTSLVKTKNFIMSEGKILCAVDFGTTYSGVAYAYVEDGAKVRRVFCARQAAVSRVGWLTLGLWQASDVEMELIEDHWPGRATSSSPKVPTYGASPNRTILRDVANSLVVTQRLQVRQDRARRLQMGV